MIYFHNYKKFVCHMHTPTPSPLTERIIAWWAKNKTCVGVVCDKICRKIFHCLMLGSHINPTKIPRVWACRMHLRELSSRVLRKLRPQTLKNSDPLGVSKTKTSRKPQIPGCLENSDPQYFPNIATNYRPSAASLCLSHLQKRNFVLQKYRLSESSHWQNFDKTKFCWRFVMRPFVRIVTFDEVLKLRGQICWWSLNLFSRKSCQKIK